MALNLLVTENSVNARILITSKYAGVNLNVVNQNSPIGQSPVLETSEGLLFEQNAISRYIARKATNGSKLVGSNDFEHALVDQWIDFAVSQIEFPGSVWLLSIRGTIEFNGEAFSKSKGDVRKALDLLNKHLTTRTFLVGERISLADIAVAVTLLPLYAEVIDSGFRKVFNHTNRWFSTCINQSSFFDVIGSVALCERAPPTPKPAKPTVVATEAKPKPQQQQQQKKETPKKKKKDDDDDADDNNLEEEIEKKSTNPLDLLPPTKLNLDEWKRFYCSQDTRSVAMPWFWEHFEEDGWSIWIADYKYNSELDSILRTNNLIGGYMQRSDRVRKYGFGNILIFGDEPTLQISACWLFRGQNIPAEMLAVDDCELYEWKKVDTKDEKVRKTIADYWAWGGFEDRKFHSAKTFK
eukprot:TRINITY_DN215_c0_g2_i3.p1 TRINITY_DN215_c0_g2~~TRINITY_DN215_c0_g2_i3.p1  ORF type:complete len:410 (+),score=250.28 TRINITY_DN215_c0_g2_i3:153-1382(+)